MITIVLVIDAFINIIEKLTDFYGTRIFMFRF
jgi:hypothetical protein